MKIFREIKWTIKNLFSYFNIVRKDRDWDYTYLYDLIEFKLERMLKYAENHTSKIVMNAPHQIKYMKLALKMIKTLKNEKFSDLEFWKDVHYHFEPTDETEKFFKMVRESNYTDEQISEQLNKEHKYAEKYHKLFWKIMERRIRTWWE